MGEPLGLGKFGNDFYWWFLGTFCLLKEFLKKNRKKNFFPKKNSNSIFDSLGPPYEYEKKMKKI